MRATAGARLSTSAWLLTSACVTLAMVLELGLVHPLRLPGHRALPTVAALLCFAQLLPASLVAGYALLAPTIILLARAQHGATLNLYVLWVVGAAGALALRHVERRVLGALAYGGGYGLFRAALFSSGTAHGDSIRILGNVGFGLLGAVLALFILRPVEKI